MSKNLVIVESPAKAKTIGKFLGNEFEVMSSMGHIRDLSEKTLRLFEHAHEVPHDYKKEGRYWVRERGVYYDTDGIREHQREEVMDCPDCPGLLVIRSSTDFRTWTLCLHLPLGACPACRAEAEARRGEALGKKLRLEYADRDNDLYERL